MTLRIQTVANRKSTIFVLTGRIQSEHLPDLKSLLDRETSCNEVVLDLKELKLADRESIRFLARREAEGAKITNCPAYIREWISREQIER